MLLVGLVFLSSTPFVLVSPDKIGHTKRIYLAHDLPPGVIHCLALTEKPTSRCTWSWFSFPLLAQCA
jgi:hypothetical protein